MTEQRADMNKSTVDKLAVLEYKLSYLIEARAHMIITSPLKAKECLDKERKLDMARRNEKLENLKRLEVEHMLS